MGDVEVTPRDRRRLERIINTSCAPTLVRIDRLVRAVAALRAEVTAAELANSQASSQADDRVQQALAAVRADAWDEGYGSDLTCETPRTNPYRRTPEGETK